MALGPGAAKTAKIRKQQKDSHITERTQGESSSQILHLSNWHDDCSSCDLWCKYFGTKQLLENHNRETHNKKDNMTESECEEIVEKKRKKKKKNSKE